MQYTSGNLYRTVQVHSLKKKWKGTQVYLLIKYCTSDRSSPILFDNSCPLCDPAVMLTSDPLCRKHNFITACAIDFIYEELQGPMFSCQTLSVFMTDVRVIDVKHCLQLPVVTVNPALRWEDSVCVCVQAVWHNSPISV